MKTPFNDIAERLKDVPRDDCRNDQLCSEAAIEIAQLRKRLDALRQRTEKEKPDG